MQASSPLPPLSPRTKWLIALCLCVLVMLLEFLTYHMAYRIGYDEGMLTTPPVVVQKSDEKAMQNLSRFMADVFASRESLAGILDNREERLAWIRDPELRTETAWGLTRELISRGGVVPALPAARELIDAGYAAGRYQVWAPRADAVAKALLAEHQYTSAYDYLKTAEEGYEKEGMAEPLVRTLQTMSSIDQMLNRNEQANMLLQRAVDAAAHLGPDALPVRSRLLAAQGAEERRKPGKNCIEIRGAKENNLQNVNVKFPIGLFNVVTGVSGSGKSTLINEILYKGLANQLYRSNHKVGAHKEIRGLEHIDKIINIDQSPIGRTPRSNPATYTGVFDAIRELYSQTPEAKMRGYKQGRFSFNVKGGRCEACRGDGIIKIEMHFLPDVYVPCEVCKGARYNRETLEVKYKGKSIADVLDMTVDDAVEFFSAIPKINRKMVTLQEVGLGYIRLGQAATTLSGGEAQRVKLATELARRSTGKTLYILEGPQYSV